MAATVWRIAGIETGGGDLVLTQLRLRGATDFVDTGATFTSSVPPISGTLPAATFAAADVRQPGFYIEITLPTAQDVWCAQFASPTETNFVVNYFLQYLDGGVFKSSPQGRLVYQGAGVLSLAVQGAPGWDAPAATRDPTYTINPITALLLSPIGQIYSTVPMFPQGVLQEPILINPILIFHAIEFGGVGRIYGNVARKHDPANVPLRRRVRLRRSRDGMPVAETWSKEDGSYEFLRLSLNYEYDVEAHDYQRQYRSVIANNLIPEAVPGQIP